MNTIEEVNLTTRSEKIADFYLSCFPTVATFVRRRGGDLEEAKEVFQESLVLFYEKTALEGFVPEKGAHAYLLGIAKNKWLKTLERRSRNERLGDREAVEESSAEPMTEKLLQFLQLAGERCMNLLQAFYYEKLSMNQLARRFGYGSERSVTVQKYKCLEKVRTQVKQKSMTYEDFLS